MIKIWFKENWLKVVAVALVLGALSPLFPYAYYQLMAWIVSGASIMTAMQARDQKKTFLMWLFIFVAVVFNPLAPLYLRADIWQIADIVVAILFILSFFLIRKPDLSVS